MTPNYKYSEGVSLRRDYVKIPDIKGRVTHTHTFVEFQHN